MGEGGNAFWGLTVDSAVPQSWRGRVEPTSPRGDVKRFVGVAGEELAFACCGLLFPPNAWGDSSFVPQNRRGVKPQGMCRDRRQYPDRAGLWCAVRPQVAGSSLRSLAGSLVRAVCVRLEVPRVIGGAARVDGSESWTRGSPTRGL
jgi:hypothetical protein